jgi:hypothetical protein
MPSPQTLVNTNIALGLPGTVAYDVATNSQNRIIDSSTLGIANVVGYAYTETVVNGVAVATAGGTGEFAGILVEPKAYSSASVVGTSSYAIANGSVGHLLNHGAVFVAVPAAAAIGDSVFFSQTTGAISTGTGQTATPSAGFTKIRNAKVDYFGLTAAGVAVIKIIGV